MKDKIYWTNAIAYVIIFLGVWTGLVLFPVKSSDMFDLIPFDINDFVNILTSLLFTLFVWLTARLARIGRTAWGVLATAAFILLFCPGEEIFFDRDEAALTELSSQCIVPFFISQYNRVSQKELHKWHFLMLLMGIFCSYTHNGITIPLCCAFVWLAFQRRERFFRQACWPMVFGVIIGTGLSLYQKWDDSLTATADLEVMSTVTSIALKTLWETKVFVLSIVLSIYLTSRHSGRKILRHIARRHYVLALCGIFSLLTLPFAPLGIENAVTGVCFFSMFWVLFIFQYYVEKYLNHKL